MFYFIHTFCFRFLVFHIHTIIAGFVSHDKLDKPPIIGIHHNMTIIPIQFILIATLIGSQHGQYIYIYLMLTAKHMRFSISQVFLFIFKYYEVHTAKIYRLKFRSVNYSVQLVMKVSSFFAKYHENENIHES